MNRTRRAFDYQPPTFEEASKLTERRGGRYDNIIKQDGPRFFKAKAGDNFIRILPPTWDKARHYALPIKTHREIGPDNATYLCLKENETSPDKNCPICEERNNLSRQRAPQKELDALRPQTSLLIYLVDRSNEDQGPVIWTISNKSDLEILAQSLEKRQQRYLPIAHPIDGYDVEFIRDGEGFGTRYRGFKVARTTSPLHDNPDKLEEWLNFIEDHPIPDILSFYSAERIESVFHGKSAPTQEEEHQPRIRETPPPVSQSVSEQPTNGHDKEPPFEVEEPRRLVDPEPRQEVQQERVQERPVLQERPAPRDIEPPNSERRRATLEETRPEGGGRPSLDALRAKLQQRNP